jgi:predicted DNA-binding protein
MAKIHMNMPDEMKDRLDGFTKETGAQQTSVMLLAIDEYLSYKGYSHKCHYKSENRKVFK